MQYEFNKDIRIIIADDHELFRDGLKLMLSNQPQIKLVAEATNGQELLEKVAEHYPDIALVDVNMPGINGIEACKILFGEFPSLKLIAISMYDDIYSILDMLSAGARGYLLKNANKNEVMQAIMAVQKDQSYYCGTTGIKLAEFLANNAYATEHSMEVQLTEREKEVARLICQERTTKEIADLMHLSDRTVEGYRTNLMEKTNSQNLVGIVLYAVRHKIYIP